LLREEVRGDPDRFVEQLRTWPIQRLDACNYAVGVMATIAADMEFPYDLEGDPRGHRVRVRFVPAEPMVQLSSASTPRFAALGPSAVWASQKLEGEVINNGYDAWVREVAARALRRYAQPTDIEPSWEAELEFVFKTRP